MTKSRKMFLSLRFFIVSALLYNKALCDDVKNATTEIPDMTTTQNSQSVPVPVSANASTNEVQNASNINMLNSFTSEVNKNLFSSDVKDIPESVIWSPFSVYNTLIPLYHGAGGSTLEELKNCLQVRDEKDLLSSQISPNSPLTSFTGLFLSQNVTLNPSYKERVLNSTAEKNPGMTTKMESVDFKKNLVKSTAYINEAIENATGGMIVKMLDPTAISSDTKMIIVNAVQFKGKWKTPFDAKATKSDTFRGLKNNNKVDLMSQKGTFEFAEFAELNASIAELEYADSSFVCQFILPDEGTSVQSVWKAVNGKGVIDEISKRLQPQEMEIVIPKMRIESDVPIQDALTKMGLSTLFIPLANLSRMLLPSKTDLNDVYVSKMVHRTAFETDEQGTKAAAATAGFLIPLSGFVSKNQVFRVDKPFIIVLKDARTGTIVFMGYITDLHSGEKISTESSDRVNLIAPSEAETPKEANDTRDIQNKIPDSEGISKEPLALVATTEAGDEWWKHTGIPEYLTLPVNETTTPSNTATTLMTPRFQQPEPNIPSAIRFPYPYRPEFKVNSSNLAAKNQNLKKKDISQPQGI